MACLYKKQLWENNWCPVTCFYCTLWQESHCEHNKATNADRIRAMSDEELTTFINKIVVCHHLRNDGYCEKCPIHQAKPCDEEGVLQWLKQPAKGE